MMLFRHTTRGLSLSSLRTFPTQWRCLSGLLLPGRKGSLRWFFVVGRRTGLSYSRAEFQTSSLRIIQQDEHLVIVDKPCGMMSVPGRQVQALADGSVPKRTAQWEAAICAAQIAKANAHSHAPKATCSEDVMDGAASGTETHAKAEDEISLQLSAASCAVLDALVSVPNVGGIPRKEWRFYTYLDRVLRAIDLDIQQCVWQCICSHDAALHRRKLVDIPPHLVSADDLVRAMVPGPILHVHRLDMETSGVLLFARSEDACAALCEQFRERSVQKTYIAEVFGSVCPTLRRVDVALKASATRPYQLVDGDFDADADKMMRGEGKGYGKDALTIVEVLEKRTASTVVQLQPKTGRTHQLRVHMAHSGHHILGDTLYNTADSLAASEYLRLHAQSLQFKHPVTGHDVVVKSDSCSFF